MAGKVYKMIPIETIRGCPFTCKFCNSPDQMRFYKGLGSNFYRKKRMDLNVGFKISENQILSIYGRTDNHNTTRNNQTYKLNFAQTFGQLKLAATHSTGLRNPSLYELYGSDNYGIGGNPNLKPEKSKTNEIYGEYNFSDKLRFTSTAYRAKISDRIESNAAYSKHENQLLSLNQEGLESELLFNGNNQVFGLFTNISKSKKTNGAAQNRRPAISYGGNYSRKFETSKYDTLNKKISIDNKLTSIEGNWEFNSRVSKVFDKHVRKSIPFYDDIQMNVSRISEWFIKDGSVYYDIGYSTGQTIYNIFQRHKKKNIKIYGLDLQNKMLWNHRA